VDAVDREAKELPYFISTKVTEAARYFFDLEPNPGTNLVVVFGGYEKMRPDYLVHRRRLSYFVLEFVTAGAGTVALAGRRYEVCAGTAFSYGPGVEHTIQTEESRLMKKYYIGFLGKGARRLVAQSPMAGWQAVHVSSPNEVEELFEILQREGLKGSPFSKRICTSALPLLILKIAELAIPHVTRESRALATYHRVKNWFEQNYVHTRSVQEAANSCHVEVAYLTRLFQRFGHTTPYQYLIRLKMNRAAQLLSDHRLMVKEVAAALHFVNTPIFSRIFKRHYGVSPTEFSDRAGEKTTVGQGYR
jgi:AraC-like DNA-binding protein